MTRVPWIPWMLGAALLSACPGAGDQGPSAECTKEHEKCLLSAGVLGVCNVVDCAEGKTAPCLVCRSQH